MSALAIPASVASCSSPSAGLRRDLRVLTLTPFYPSREDPSQGGFVAEVLSHTRSFGIHNRVIAVRPFYRDRAHSLASEIPCRWQSYFSPPGNWGLPYAGVFLAARLASIFKSFHDEKPIDLIHAHGALPCGHAAAKLSQRFGIPFLVSVHGLDVFYERQAGRAGGVRLRKISEEIYSAARAVICISEKVGEALNGIGTNRRTVYNGVDASLFSPGAEQGAPVILTVGNLIPTKGHALLLRSFARVSSVSPEWRLRIIGDGPEYGKLLRLAESLQIEKRVQFLGRLDRPAVARAMQSCALFALPSSYESLGCVYLEAMACGKAVIGCSGQGIDEIIEQGINGLVVPPGSEEALTETLGKLMQNEALRYNIGKAARETVLNRHTLQHQAAQLSEIYEECRA